MIQTFDAPPEMVKALKDKAKEKGIKKSKLIRVIIAKQLGLKDQKIL